MFVIGYGYVYIKRERVNFGKAGGGSGVGRWEIGTDSEDVKIMA